MYFNKFFYLDERLITSPSTVTIFQILANPDLWYFTLQHLYFISKRVVLSSDELSGENYTLYDIFFFSFKSFSRFTALLLYSLLYSTLNILLQSFSLWLCLCILHSGFWYFSFFPPKANVVYIDVWKPKKGKTLSWIFFFSPKNIQKKTEYFFLFLFLSPSTQTLMLATNQGRDKSS